VDGFIQLVDDFLAKPVQGERVRAALGCVPYFTSFKVVNCLRKMACCIVVDKKAVDHRAIHDLNETGVPFPADALQALIDHSPKDEKGAPQIVGPWGLPPAALGPVKVLGYGGEGSPQLHAKLLVLGYIDNSVDAFESGWFAPQVVWWGSANWTNLSPNHLEMATFSTDPLLCEKATEFMTGVLLLSEPLGSTSPIPFPDLALVEYDEEGFVEALGWVDPREL